MARAILKSLLWGILVYFLLSFFGNKFVKFIDYTAEKSYWEGQKDYRDGDIRVDSANHWVRSPWNTGRLPEFNP